MSNTSAAVAQWCDGCNPENCAGCGGVKSSAGRNPRFERTIMRAAIAKWGRPAHSGEPVAWLDPWTGAKATTDYDAYGKHGIPLYTAPQPVEREPLTDEQMYNERQTAGPQLLDLAKLWADNRIHVYQFVHEAEKIVTAVARRVEAAHGIKGGQHG